MTPKREEEETAVASYDQVPSSFRITFLPSEVTTVSCAYKLYENSRIAENKSVFIMYIGLILV
jgi:hypothetical protein